jgi:hypothetical protein
MAQTEIRTVMNPDQRHFQRCIATDERGVDEIDRDFDDLIVVDPYESHASSRRSDKELTAVLALLDNLEQEMEESQ